jgi:23S rRNA pseudouridine1911/1915/1917 synthase
VYWAIVKNKPLSNEGTLKHWLLKDEKKNRTTAFKKETAGAQYAELDYRVMAKAAGHWLLEVKPLTGRPHQIRVQLASMNCPIKGDIKYGGEEPNEDGSICLHAKQLSFQHPVQKTPLIVEAPPPDMGLWKYFLKLDLG